MARTYLSESPVSGSPHLFIATAAYQFHPNYTHSLAAAMPLLFASGVAVDLCHVADHCHVDDARNAMVRQFMMSKATHLVFVDNDVGFSADALLKLARHDRDMVAGIYPLKEETEGYPVRVKPGVDLCSDADGLVEVEGLPTGFMKISRRCLEQMIAVHGDRKFYGRGQSQDDPPNVILFERTYENGVRYSGDYAFCEKWKAMGGKMYVDPEMSFTHSGSHEWAGCLGDYWRRVHGVNDQRFAWAVEQMRAGTFNGEVAQALSVGWGNPYAASSNTLATCWHLAKKSHSILETGSGLTSLVMGLANPEARIVSMESEPRFAEETRARLQEHGVSNVQLQVSRLRDGWYSEVPTTDFDLVVLDGPNRLQGDRGKAFTTLDMQGATVIADDADDPSILGGFNAWAKSQGRSVSVLGIKSKTTAVSARPA